MIREFALVILDATDTEIDRLNLDLVNNPKGLGFTIENAVIKTDVEDMLVSFRQTHEIVTLNVNYAFGHEYLKARGLRTFIEKYMGERLHLEWETPVQTLLAGCAVDRFDFSEISDNKILSVPLTLRLLTPFFDVVNNEITITPGETGKIYTYTYPYTYGEGVISNNEINNTYIKSVPLNITLYGEMATPSVSIRVKGDTASYASVAFIGLSLAPNMWLNINAVEKNITLFNGSSEVDAYDYIDGTRQSFIYARRGLSELLASVQSDRSGRMRASFRRYWL